MSWADVCLGGESSDEDEGQAAPALAWSAVALSPPSPSQQSQQSQPSFDGQASELPQAAPAVSEQRERRLCGRKRMGYYMPGPGRPRKTRPPVQGDDSGGGLPLDQDDDSGGGLPLAEEAEAAPPRRSRVEAAAHARAKRAERRSATALAPSTLIGHGRQDDQTVAIRDRAARNNDGQVLAAALDRSLADVHRRDLLSASSSSPEAKVSNFFFSSRAKTICSNKKTAEELGIHPAIVAATHNRVATAYTQLEARAFDKMTKALKTAKDLHVHMAIIKYKYDETPMKLNIDGMKVVAKILQSQVEWGLLCESPVTGFFHMRGKRHSWLQVLEATTAELILHATTCLLKEFEDALAHLDPDTFLHMAMTDDAGSNNRAELARVFVHLQHLKVHFRCCIHKIFAVAKAVYQVNPMHISGCVHFSLTFMMAGAMRKFRHELAELIDSRLIIFHGDGPGEEADKYRRAVYNLFIGSGVDLMVNKIQPKTMSAKVVMETLFNGDIRVPGEVHHWCSRGCCPDEATTRRRFRTLGVQALAGAKPHIFPQHRWVGSDRSLDWVGLGEAVHQLCGDAFFQHLTGKLRPRSGGGVADAAVALQGDAGRAPDEDVVDHGDGDEEAEGGAQSLYEKGARSRKRALRWVGEFPLMAVTVMRVSITPFANLMSHHLTLAGTEWDTLQMKNVQKGGSREYRVLHLHHGTYTRPALREAVDLFWDEEAWAALASSSWTVASATMAYKHCAKSAGATFHHLILPSRGFPLRLFTILEDPSVAQYLKEVFDERPCCLDPFTLCWMKSIDDIASPYALEKLKLIATMADIDIVSVEARHASIRRRLVTCSTQTRCERLARTSAAKVLRDVRIELYNSIFASPRVAPANSSAVSAAVEDQPGGGGGGGGAWRAFLRREAIMASPEASAAYRALSAEDRTQLQEVGAAATTLHRLSGQHGFGGRLGERGQGIAQRQNFNQQALEEHTSGRAPPCRNIAVLVKEDLSEKLKAIYGLARQHNMALRKEEQCERELLQKCLAKPAGLFDQLEYGSEQAKAQLAVQFQKSPGEASMRWCPELLVSSASATAVAEQSAARAKLGPALDKAWAEKHHIHMQTDTAPIHLPKVRKNKCLAAGFCVCKGRGAVHHASYKLFLKLFKNHFPPKTEARERLVQGDIVVRLTGETPEPRDPNATPQLTVRWWHLPFLLLNDWWGTWIELTPRYDDFVVDATPLRVRWQSDRGGSRQQVATSSDKRHAQGFNSVGIGSRIDIFQRSGNGLGC